MCQSQLKNLTVLSIENNHNEFTYFSQIVSLTTSGNNSRTAEHFSQNPYHVLQELYCEKIKKLENTFTHQIKVLI